MKLLLVRLRCIDFEKCTVTPKQAPGPWELITGNVDSHHFRGAYYNYLLALQTLRLWEAIWSCPLTAHFPIYLCAAALQLNKERIMQCGPCFDELLSFCVLLSGDMDLSRTIRRAENLFQAAGSRGLKCLQGLETVP